jgi:hypothetical protein
MVAVTTSGVLFLIFDVVAGRGWAVAAAPAGVLLFGLLWFAVPALAGQRAGAGGDVTARGP